VPLQPKTTSEELLNEIREPGRNCRTLLGKKPKGGAPKGNRNALKQGRYTAAAIARRREFFGLAAEFHAHVGVVLGLAEREIARRHGHAAAGKLR
jgi:2-hydroxychromene-2-carboxylate isomerase